jgi:phage tail sheath protein FI
MSAHFKIGNVGPSVLINVLDPDTHNDAVTAESRTIGADGTAKLAVKHPLPSTVVVKNSTDATTHVLGTDYSFALNAAGEGIVTRITTGAITAGATIHVAYTALDPTEVLAADVVGSVDATTQAKTGLELVAEVFPRFRLVPGQILAPGFSSDTTVIAAARAKAASINGVFKAVVLADIPTGTVVAYSAAAAWKNTAGFTTSDLVVCWPMGRLGDTLYHLSTLTAARALQTDADNDGLPFETPSNKALPIDGIALADGTEVILGKDAADSLDDQGIVTALNFIGGWRLWGNHTAVYPASTDPADALIQFVRMRAWYGTSLVLSHWQRVDSPANRRQIESVVDSENIRLNGLQAAGAILGARVSFDEDLNPITSLLDGRCVYSVRWMPAPAMSAITFNVEVDPTYLSTLFA